jgi:hypothetical protein
MKQFISVIAFLLLIASPAVMQTSAVQTTAVAPADQHRTMLNTYCVTCHNMRLKTGGLALDWRGNGITRKSGRRPCASCAGIRCRLQAVPNRAEGCRFVCCLDGELTGFSGC